MTVAVASYQRERHLAKLLDSLAGALSAPSGCDVDVFVVLDGSTDGSAAHLESIRQRFPVALRYVWQPNGGLAAARNACIVGASGELVWLLDDDMVVTREALQHHLGHRRETARILMGPCQVRSGDPDIVRSTWWYEERHRRLTVDGRVRDPHDSSFANTSAPTSLLREHPFDERFKGYGVEDFELALRLLALGEVIAFDPGAVVIHDYRPSRSESLRKLREEGTNRIKFVDLHPSHGDVVFRPDPGRAERILRHAARLPIGSALWALAVCADHAASMRLPRRHRHRLLGFADQAAIYSGVSSGRSSERR